MENDMGLLFSEAESAALRRCSLEVERNEAGISGSFEEESSGVEGSDDLGFECQFGDTLATGAKILYSSHLPRKIAVQSRGFPSEGSRCEVGLGI
jgi:hypothetical protein